MTGRVAVSAQIRFLAVVIAVEVVASVTLANLGAIAEREVRENLGLSSALVGELGLTDLALWSEARYCRHPSQADLFSSHADHPLALDHFPAGSFVPPPRHLLLVGEAGTDTP